MFKRKSDLNEGIRKTARIALGSLKVITAPVIGSLDERTQRVFYNLAPRKTLVGEDKRYRSDGYIEFANFASRIACCFAYPYLSAYIMGIIGGNEEERFLAGFCGFTYGVTEAALRWLAKEEDLISGIRKSDYAYSGTLIGSIPGKVIWTIYDRFKGKREK